MKNELRFDLLFQEFLEDLYDAEKQNAAARPKWIAAASSAPLSVTLEAHLEDTRQQVARLEELFERMAIAPGTRQCRVMTALLDDGARMIEEFEKSPVLDAGIVAVAQKVQHYEIAAYRLACALAELLGQQDAFDLLQESLQEEMEMEDRLTELNEAILAGDERAA